MATVVTPHSASQSAMAVRSQELAPNERTFAGAPAAWAGAGATRSAGTHTMCMSEWTSMPAALGLRTGKAAGCARGGCGAGLGGAWVADGLAGAAERLGRLMVGTSGEGCQ